MIAKRHPSFAIRKAVISAISVDRWKTASMLAIEIDWPPELLGRSVAFQREKGNRVNQSNVGSWLVARTLAHKDVRDRWKVLRRKNSDGFYEYSKGH